MKFSFTFSISKTDYDFKFRFWKWELWGINSNDDSFEKEEEIVLDKNKAGYIQGEEESNQENKEEGEEKKLSKSRLLFHVLFYPDVEKKIFNIWFKFIRKIWNLFSIETKYIEWHGTFGDPFYDAVVFGLLPEVFYPDWENKNNKLILNGNLTVKISFIYILILIFDILYTALYLAFTLWRGTKRAKKNPNGNDLSSLRKWVFLKTKDFV